MPETITNYDGRLEQMANYCETMLDNIAKVNNAYHDSVEDKYSASLPDHLIKWKGLKQVGGRTLVANNKFNGFPGQATWITNWTAAGLTITQNNNADGSYTFTFNGTPTWEGKQHVDLGFTFSGGHKYVIKGCPPNGSADTFYFGIGGGANDIGDGYYFAPANNYSSTLRFYVAGGVTFDNVTTSFEAIDLTEMFGAGNEPASVAEYKAIIKTAFPCNMPSTLLSAGVNKIVSKDSSNNVLDELDIPDEITTAEGYGWSCPGAYNYIDFDTKKFVQAVGIRAYESGDESDATVITDGTNTYYKLDAPLEFDVSEYLTDTELDVEANGSVTFENQHGEDYCIPVPVQLEYIGI